MMHLYALLFSFFKGDTDIMNTAPPVMLSVPSLSTYDSALWL